MSPKFEHIVAMALYGSRWLLAPAYAGLVAALAIILVAFFRELVHAAVDLGVSDNSEVILAAFTQWGPEAVSRFVGTEDDTAVIWDVEPFMTVARNRVCVLDAVNELRVLG